MNVKIKQFLASELPEMVSITITDPVLSDFSQCMFVDIETNYNND